MGRGQGEALTLPECSKPMATKAVMGPHSPSAFPGSEEEEAAWNTAMHTSLGNRNIQEEGGGGGGVKAVCNTAMHTGLVNRYGQFHTHSSERPRKRCRCVQ